MAAALMNSVNAPLSPSPMAAEIDGLSAPMSVERSNILIVDDRLDKRVVFRTILEELEEKSVRALKQGIDAVVGAVDFVRSLPPDLPKAVASSSSTRWIRGHLDHLGLTDAFGEHVYSGREHVERGKPAPDIYLYAADQIGSDIGRSVILEDSEVGAKGALASGATVIGLAAGRHCFDGHEEMLRAVGIEHVAHSFEEVAAFVGLYQTSK
jgi:HAD superfamily hydrolase (TIGR01509 family)